MTSLKPLGEVIAASTTHFTAQCVEAPRADTVPELPDPPAFGSLVRVGRGPSDLDNVAVPPLPDDYDPFTSPVPVLSTEPDDGSPLTLYGVVFHAETGALEAGRSLTAFGLDEDELRRSQPQIYELLATRFSALLIAYSGSDGTIRPYLPPRPPRPHSRVWRVDARETRRLTENLTFLRSLLSGASGASYPPDDLVAALLRQVYVAAYPGDTEFLFRVGRELATLLPMDYDRLRAIVSRIIA